MIGQWTTQRCGWGLAGICVMLGCGRLQFAPAPNDITLDAVAPDAPPLDAPDPSGCADGTREGFVDQTQFPTLAGCAASWDGTPSMRAPGTGIACGYGRSLAGNRINEIKCATPRDACAIGWHLCAETTLDDWLAAGGRQGIGDLSQADCLSAGDGPDNVRFGIATSHANPMDPCSYAGRNEPSLCHDQYYGGEPICCGRACSNAAACNAAIDGWTFTPTMSQSEVRPDTNCRILRDLSIDPTLAAPPIAGVQCCRDR